MTVPKCKNCDSHFLEFEEWYQNKEHHYCRHEKVLSKNTVRVFITAQESKTSPKWCPKRA